MTRPVSVRSDKVVYTAILGRVDLLRAPEIVDDGWDYVCFSDEPIDCSPWRLAPIERSEPTLARDARYLKVNATTLLPGAAVSLWLDGNIELAASAQALVDRYLDGPDIVLHAHPERDCLFDEAVAVIDQGKDATATVMAQVLRYARSGVPPNTGLHATAAILRRHTPRIRQLEATWWGEIARGSHRDQLSLPYALQSNHLRCAEFDGDVWFGSQFRYRPHDGPNAPRKFKMPDGRKRHVDVPAPHLPSGP
jgi:hypothetical protein